MISYHTDRNEHTGNWNRYLC